MRRAAPTIEPGAVKPRRMSQDVLGVFGSRTFGSLLGTITGIILARTLGPHDRGIFALVVLLPSTLVTITKLGITQANVYCVRREGAKLEMVATNSLLLALILGLGTSAIVWLARGSLLSTMMRGVPEWALLLALWRYSLLLIDNFFCGVLQANNNFSMYNRRTLAGIVLVLVAVVTLRLTLRLNLWTGVLMPSVSCTVVVVSLLIATYRMMPFGLWPNLPLLGRQVQFGVKSYMQVLTMHLLFRLDVYMVAYFLDPAQTAFYSLALHFTEMLLEIPQAVGWVVYPRLASLPKQEAHRLTAQACRRTVLLTGCGGLAMIILGPFMVPLWYGQAYATASQPLAAATLGAVMMSVFTIITRDFTSRNNQAVNIRAGVVALLSNVGLNLYMIPKFGIVGAALSTSFSYSLAAIMVMIPHRRESGMALSQMIVPTAEDARFLWKLSWDAVNRGAVNTSWLLARVGLGRTRVVPGQ